MPPETPQPPAEESAPVTESPVPAEPAQAPLETAQTEVTTPEPASEAATEPATAQESARTAQIPPNEPIAPEPPSSAAPVQTGILHSARDLLTKARVAIQDRKRKKRDKIMLALTTKSKITNDEVEKLLHVSDATATRYLAALEKENKIKQVGKTGGAVKYEKI